MTDDLRILRSYSEPLELRDGRNISGRCIPYDQPAMVCEPGGDPYREVIRPRAFRRAIRAAGMVLLNYEHQSQDLGNQIGPSIDLTETDDGLYATFRALETPLGDHALALIRSGVTGLSVEAIMSNRHSRILEDGTVERSFARQLCHVALTGQPAYADAGVLSVRSRPAEVEAPRADRIAEIRDWSDRSRVRFSQS
jgi:HK97 family phage prohead protease